MRIASFSELFEVLQEFRGGRWVFRGLPDLSYELIPKVGRLMQLAANEQRIFDSFRRELPAFLQGLDNNEWELLAIAQHHGLPTRFLDWSELPLVGAYFSCNRLYDRDGVIYAMKNPHVVRNYDRSPFDAAEVARYRPRHINQRIRAQRGLFTVHPEPSTPLKVGRDRGVTIQAIEVACEYKEQLAWDLARFGVHRSSLFPDLDGLAGYISWKFENYDPSKSPEDAN